MKDDEEIVNMWKSNKKKGGGMKVNHGIYEYKNEESSSEKILKEQDV